VKHLLTYRVSVLPTRVLYVPSHPQFPPYIYCLYIYIYCCAPTAPGRLASCVGPVSASPPRESLYVNFSRRKERPKRKNRRLASGGSLCIWTWTRARSQGLRAANADPTPPHHPPPHWRTCGGAASRPSPRANIRPRCPLIRRPSQTTPTQQQQAAAAPVRPSPPTPPRERTPREFPENPRTPSLKRPYAARAKDSAPPAYPSIHKSAAVAPSPNPRAPPTNLRPPPLSPRLLLSSRTRPNSGGGAMLVYQDLLTGACARALVLLGFSFSFFRSARPVARAQGSGFRCPDSESRGVKDFVFSWGGGSDGCRSAPWICLRCCCFLIITEL
jgi:hypothetical protein